MINRSRSTAGNRLHLCAAVAGGFALLLSSSISMASGHKQQRHAHRYSDYAQVIHVQPNYREISVQRPQRECWTEHREHRTTYEGQGVRGYGQGRSQRRHSTGNAVVGGLIGGAIGRELGRHSGSRSTRLGATIAGAVIGSAIANESPRRDRRRRQDRRHRQQHQRDYHRHQPTVSTPVKRCETRQVSHLERRIDGYTVTYRYQGQTFTTRMPRDPGNRLRVDVRVQPSHR